MGCQALVDPRFDCEKRVNISHEHPLKEQTRVFLLLALDHIWEKVSVTRHPSTDETLSMALGLVVQCPIVITEGAKSRCAADGWVCSNRTLEWRIS